MKFRHIVLFSGERFDVPQCIQRIDHRATHGWQLRYEGTKLFSDHSNDGSGASASLEAATRELVKRMQSSTTAAVLQRNPSANKSSKLPPGISGPIVRERQDGRVRDCSLAVLLPRYGKSPQRRSIYIGTERTFTAAKMDAAVKEAKAMRAEAEAEYAIAGAKSRKAEARELLRLLLQSKRENDGRVGAMAGGLATGDGDGPHRVLPARKVKTAGKRGTSKAAPVKRATRAAPVKVAAKKAAPAKRAVAQVAKAPAKAPAKVAKKAAKKAAPARKGARRGA